MAAALGCPAVSEHAANRWDPTAALAPRPAPTLQAGQVLPEAAVLRAGAAGPPRHAAPRPETVKPGVYEWALVRWRYWRGGSGDAGTQHTSIGLECCCALGIPSARLHPAPAAGEQQGAAQDCRLWAGPARGQGGEGGGDRLDHPGRHTALPVCAVPCRTMHCGTMQCSSSCSAMPCRACAPGAATPNRRRRRPRRRRAPELCMGARRYGPEVDVWSAGCIMFELLTGKALFPGGWSSWIPPACVCVCALCVLSPRHVGRQPPCPPPACRDGGACAISRRPRGSALLNVRSLNVRPPAARRRKRRGPAGQDSEGRGVAHRGFHAWLLQVSHAAKGGGTAGKCAPAGAGQRCSEQAQAGGGSAGSPGVLRAPLKRAVLLLPTLPNPTMHRPHPPDTLVGRRRATSAFSAGRRGRSSERWVSSGWALAWRCQGTAQTLRHTTLNPIAIPTQPPPHLVALQSAGGDRPPGAGPS